MQIVSALPCRPVTLRCLALLAALMGRLHATSYYVDYSTGSDTSVGTSATSPWQHSPGDPAATGAAAMILLVPGDTVFFKGGTTYVFTGTTGIALRWNGVAGNPITYDGNSSGTWGAGRAVFTDNHGTRLINAFSATTAASNLAFKNLEIAGIGGAATLPADSGSPVPSNFGGGISLPAGATGVVIDQCVFRDLGYAFNQKPMSAASLAGTAIRLQGADTVSITNCTFSRMTLGVDLKGSTTLANVIVGTCTFSDSILWPFDLPANVSGLVIQGCTETNNAQFDRGSWTGYGDCPRTSFQSAAAGTSVTFTASAAAIPTATFQWLKNGQAISGAANATLTLAAVGSTDAATYTVTATNSAGSTVSHEMVLTVTGVTTTAVAPVITTQPASQTAAPLSTVTFTVAASGSPAPTFQWFRNGVTFSGWTGAALTVSGITSNDAGSYVAVATNSAGSATSAAATLTVSSTTQSAPAPSPTATAPAITTQPVSQTVTQGATVSFTVGASGSPAPTFQWYKNGSALAGATATTLTLASVASSDAADYSAIASNSAGTATSSSATLTVNATIAPVITTQPASQIVLQGAAVSFTVAASGTPAPTFQWYRNGSALAGATATTLTLASVTSSDAANYSAVVSNSAGTATSSSATLTVNATIAPVITTQPVSVSAPSKTIVTFTSAASGTPAPTYQWAKDGAPISGATASCLTLNNVNKGATGTYVLTATNSAGSAKSNGATLTITNVKGASTSAMSTTAIDPDTIATDPATAPAVNLPSSRLVNLSVRAGAGSGAESLIVGFSVSGGSSKSLLIRGSGPALSAFGVPGVVDDPTLALYAGAELVATNDDWSSSADAAAIGMAGTRAGAFALPSAGRDAALLASVPAGSYTSQLASKDVAMGNALVELYDADPASGSRLLNISARTAVQDGGDATMIGFVVAGAGEKTLLLRAIGPALGAFGITDALEDPRLEIYRDGVRLSGNDNWQGTTELMDAFQRTGAFPLADASSKDAALIFTAPPGAYTATVTSANGAVGTVLLEIYEMP